MSQTKCKICQKEFYIRPSRLKIGWGKYCSIKCRNVSQRTGRYLFCAVCKKKIWKTPKEERCSKSGKFFCNKSCQTKWRNKYYSREKHHFWINGKNVYRTIMLEQKDKPVCKKCKVKDVRVLVVHHKDHDRENNKINNLMWLCRNCHHLVHIHDKKV